MSLSLKKPDKNSKDYPIAIINKKKLVYLNKDDKDDDEDDVTKNMSLNKGDSFLPYLDHNKKGGFRVFISGSTGSGKTWLSEQIIETSFYKQVNQIYLFSSIYDNDYERFGKKLLHIDIIEFINNPKNVGIDIYAKLMPDSLCIFDDILAYGPKKSIPYINLRSQILATGRHKNISIFVIEQQSKNYNKTRDVLLNCEYFVFFPKSSYVSFFKIAIEYLGMTKQQIEEFKKLKSQWLFVCKVYPQYIISERDINILN